MCSAAAVRTYIDSALAAGCSVLTCAQVRVPGRPCEQSDMAALHRALDKHYHLSTGAACTVNVTVTVTCFRLEPRALRDHGVLP
jgi:hypothetical protein